MDPAGIKNDPTQDERRKDAFKMLLPNPDDCTITSVSFNHEYSSFEDKVIYVHVSVLFKSTEISGELNIRMNPERFEEVSKLLYEQARRNLNEA